MQRPPMSNHVRQDVLVKPQEAATVQRPPPAATQSDRAPQAVIVRSPEPVIIRPPEPVIIRPVPMEADRPRPKPSAIRAPQPESRDLRNELNRRRGERSAPLNFTRPRVSVHNRLQVTPAPASDELTSDSGVSSARPVLPGNFEESLEGLSIASSRDPLAELFAFCSENNLGEPQLEIYSRKVVGCRLTVNGKTFFEYAENEALARRQVAQASLVQLKIGQRRKEYPETKEDKHDLAIRLHELLLQFPHGVLEKSLPEIFQQATGTSLPDHWTDIVTAYTRFFCVDSGALAHVVYANVLGDDAEDEEEVSMQLPWKEPHWNLYVTHVVSTTMVWARIIGAEYSTRWDALMSDVEVALGEAENRTAVEEAVVGSVYLVEQESCWFRVRCAEVDPEGKRSMCFYVDQGNEQWLANSSLVECAAKYHTVPAQAVLFSLFGLESMNENPHARPILEHTLQDKAIVAEVHSRAEDYAEGTGIKVVLYDTSGEEDRNLVEVLHDEICVAGKPPQLKAAGLTSVRITYVSDRGDVFCQVPGSGVDYVQKVIEKLVQNEDALARHRGLHETAAGGDSATRYLVFDRPNGNWCRAVLKVRHPQTAHHLMYCLDSGCQVQVEEKDIYNLQPLSAALSCYPAMVVRCELYDVPKMEPRTVSRVKGLLEPQSMALAKVMVSAGLDRVPRVNLYQRLEAPNKVIVCINDTLRMEHDFESSFA